jgi:hypothetical protein
LAPVIGACSRVTKATGVPVSCALKHRGVARPRARWCGAWPTKNACQSAAFADAPSQCVTGVRSHAAARTREPPPGEGRFIPQRVACAAQRGQSGANTPRCHACPNRDAGGGRFSAWRGENAEVSASAASSASGRGRPRARCRGGARR